MTDDLDVIPPPSPAPRVPVEPLMSTAQLLKASRKAHMAYRSVAGRTDKEGTIIQQPDEALKISAIQLALEHRLQAHLSDPSHTDPEWQNDPAPHEHLVTFYQGFLSA